MKVVVAGNITSRRTDYFIKAGRSLGVDIRFITYGELENNIASLRDTMIKLEPPVYYETDILKYDALCKLYRDWLAGLSLLHKSESVYFLNSPDAILRALDKVLVKDTLNALDLRTTPLLSGGLTSFLQLRELIIQQRNGVFLKPRYGSGAGGIMAIKYNIRHDEWVAYTTMAVQDGRVCNTKQIHRLTNLKELSFLAETVMGMNAILEVWMVKDRLDAENYDLRVVCRGKEIDYVVVRCSSGAITNLHLNNKAKCFDDLKLSIPVKEEIYRQCIKAAGALGLYYAGVDVLIARGTEMPYIIEVNGQGDHIYQDMFAGNKIYTNQLKALELFFNENR